MNILLDVLYSLLALSIGVYVLSYLIAVIAALSLFFFADVLTVDERDPGSDKSKRGVLRRMAQMDIVAVGKGGEDPRFPVIAETPRRLSVSGLADNRPGIQKDEETDWDVVRVAPRAYYSTIQSKWGYLSPLYVFRKLAHTISGRHVVRIFVPFYVWGFYALLEPIIMDFTRARSKVANVGVGRKNFIIKDELGGLSHLQIVTDETDHVKEEFPLRIVTDTLPTSSGFSIRLDITLVLKVQNLAKMVAWRNWSEQISSVVSDAVASVVRNKGVDEVYATKNASDVTIIQETVMKFLKNEGGVKPVGDNNTSVLDMLGLVLKLVTLNDLIPADTETENEIKRVMSIVLQGANEASAIAAKTKAGVEGLQGATSEQLRHLAAVTAANKAGRIDFIEGAGGGQIDLPQLLAALGRSGGSNTGGTP